MAISVNFYNYGKRKNSTGVPSGGTAVSCVFKDNTSYVNPTLLVNLSDVPYNYFSMTIGGVNRYYWITNIVSVRNNLFEVSGHIDVLSTYRSSIIGVSAYLLYSTATFSANLVDRRIPTIYSPVRSTQTLQVFSNFFNASGYYILSCVGENGGVDCWRLDRNQFHDLLNNIQEYQDIFNVEWPEQPNPSGDALTDIFNTFSTFVSTLVALGESIVNVFKQQTSFSSAVDCIRGCFWIPFEVTSLNTGEITLGGYHTGITANRVADTIAAEIGNIAIPWPTSDWRNSAYCTEMSIYLPFVGTVTLPSSAMIGASTLALRQCLSTKTGDVAYELLAGDMVIGTYGGNAAVSVPIGSSNISNMQIVNAIGQAASAITASSNPVSGATGVVNAVSNAVTPMTNSVGGVSSAAGSGLQMTAALTSVYYATVEAPSASTALRGRPAFISSTIPSSGFVQTYDWHTAAAASEPEKIEIDNFVNGGVYIE